MLQARIFILAESAVTSQTSRQYFLDFLVGPPLRPTRTGFGCQQRSRRHCEVDRNQLRRLDKNAVTMDADTSSEGYGVASDGV